MKAVSLFLALAGCFLGTPSAWAAEGTPDRWVTRTFQVHPSFRADCLPRESQLDGPGGFGDAGFPALPDAKAAGESWRQAMDASTKLVRDFLKRHLLDTPEGSIFLYDAESGTVAVRSTEENLKLVGVVLTAYGEQVAKVATYTVEVFEADATVMRGHLEKCLADADHTAVLKQLAQEAIAGRAIRRQQIRVEAVKNVLSEVSSGGARLQIQAEVDDTPWEADMPPRQHWVSLDLEIPQGTSPKSASARIVTSVLLRSGRPRLVAAWDAPAASETGREIMCAAFLRPDLAPLFPKENAVLVRMIETHAAEPPVAPPVQTDAAVTGVDALELRLIPLWRDSGLAGDPDFSRKGARQSLKDQGISFPEGADAACIQSISLLVMKNTRASLGLAEVYRGEPVCRIPRPIFDHTLTVVEGDPDTMNALVRRAEGKVDHGDVWSEAETLASQGKARIARILRLCAPRSERAWLGAGAWAPKSKGSVAPSAEAPGKQGVMQEMKYPRGAGEESKNMSRGEGAGGAESLPVLMPPRVMWKDIEAWRRGFSGTEVEINSEGTWEELDTELAHAVGDEERIQLVVKGGLG